MNENQSVRSTPPQTSRRILIKLENLIEVGKLDGKISKLIVTSSNTEWSKTSAQLSDK